MRVLLDTHIIFWAITGDSRLSQNAIAIIRCPENYIFYSMVSIWEVTIKHIVHPEKMSLSGVIFSKWCKSSGYRKLNIREGHIFTLETLHRAEGAPKHNDPFDRLLIAQAKAESMIFLTHDSMFTYYNEPCVTLV